MYNNSGSLISRKKISKILTIGLGMISSVALIDLYESSAMKKSIPTTSGSTSSLNVAGKSKKTMASRAKGFAGGAVRKRVAKSAGYSAISDSSDDEDIAPQNSNIPGSPKLSPLVGQSTRKDSDLGAVGGHEENTPWHSNPKAIKKIEARVNRLPGSDIIYFDEMGPLEKSYVAMGTGYIKNVNKGLQDLGETSSIGKSSKSASKNLNDDLPTDLSIITSIANGKGRFSPWDREVAEGSPEYNKRMEVVLGNEDFKYFKPFKTSEDGLYVPKSKESDI